MTEAENNRRCAEALGFLEPTKDETEEIFRKGWSMLRNWTLRRRSNAPTERFSSYYWTPPDFLHSESASAMLLEAMPHPELSFSRFKATPSFWMCRADFTKSNEFGYEAVRNPDRKTAIRDAFLALVESGNHEHY